MRTFIQGHKIVGEAEVNSRAFVFLGKRGSKVYERIRSGRKESREGVCAVGEVRKALERRCWLVRMTRTWSGRQGRGGQLLAAKALWL